MSINLYEMYDYIRSNKTLHSINAFTDYIKDIFSPAAFNKYLKEKGEKSKVPVNENKFLTDIIDIERNYNEIMLGKSYNFCGVNVKLFSKIFNNVEPKNAVDKHCKALQLKTLANYPDEEKIKKAEEEFIENVQNEQDFYSLTSTFLNLLFNLKHMFIGHNLYTEIIKNGSLKTETLLELAKYTNANLRALTNNEEFQVDERIKKERIEIKKKILDEIETEKKNAYNKTFSSYFWSYS